MENDTFIDGLAIKKRWFSVAMLNNQMVCLLFSSRTESLDLDTSIRYKLLKEKYTSQMLQKKCSLAFQRSYSYGISHFLRAKSS